jgi:hypothetical protein
MVPPTGKMTPKDATTTTTNMGAGVKGLTIGVVKATSWGGGGLSPRVQILVATPFP